MRHPQGVTDLIETTADRLYAAPPTTWRGTSDLPQLPWPCPCRGLVLIIDLWSGIGGLVFAALALGLRCVVLSAEMDPDLQEAKRKYFPNLVVVSQVEDICVGMLKKFMARRVVSAILVGGGSPCQGNSFLNTNRKGLGDVRSWQPLYLHELVLSIKESFPLIPVFSFLENVASCPDMTVQQYTQLMGGEPVEINASDWGYVRRRRLFWLSGPAGGIRDTNFDLPVGIHIQTQGGRLCARKVDGKPWPPQVRFEAGYEPHFQPAEVCMEKAEPMSTFSREFWHPTDRLQAASRQAQERFELDHRRFPPSAYEDPSLLWQGAQWRQPTPAERATIMGIPTTALQQIAPGLNKAERTAKLNSIIGNGFHLPSMMLALLMLFQLGDRAMAVPAPAPLAAAAERRLRLRVRNTVFDEYYVRHSQYSMSSEQVGQVMFRLFDGIQVPDGVQAQCTADLATIDLSTLQAYWIFICENGHTEEEAPPCWKSQRQRGLAVAAQGLQRAAGGSSKGIDHLLQPGLGKERHIEQATALFSPFDVEAPLDLDLDFAILAVATFGPQVQAWRTRHMDILRQVLVILKPVQTFLATRRVPTAQAVAGERHVALMAFFTALLRWPDRDQPIAYLKGFRVIGDIPETGIFRQITGIQVDSIDEDFFGQAAEEAISDLLASKPPQDHKDIFDLTTDEIGKDYSTDFLTLTQVNRMFGVGHWRPIHRFLVHQSDGKKRLIDDGRRGHQNRWAGLRETIYTIGVDFVPLVAAAVRRKIFELRFPDANDAGMGISVAGVDIDDWADVQFSIADLPDAFRGLPIAPADQRAAVVAVFDQTRRQWRFTVMKGCPFGLGSVVVHFNRYPALLVAVARRLFGLMHGAYFDDNILIEPHVTAPAADDVLNELLRALGTPPKPSKRFDMASHRVFLGAAVTHIHTEHGCSMVLAPKEATRQQVQADIQQAIDTKRLTSAQAAKLRGRSGWLASNSFGRIGRLGSAVLKRLQYKQHSGNLSESDVRALRFHLHVVQHVPPRTINLGPSSAQRPLVLYSDAEYTEGQPPKIGLLLFRDPPLRPLGACMVLPGVLTRTWSARRQQFFQLRR